MCSTLVRQRQIKEIPWETSNHEKKLPTKAALRTSLLEKSGVTTGIAFSLIPLPVESLQRSNRLTKIVQHSALTLPEKHSSTLCNKGTYSTTDRQSHSLLSLSWWGGDRSRDWQQDVYENDSAHIRCLLPVSKANVWFGMRRYKWPRKFFETEKIIAYFQA